MATPATVNPFNFYPGRDGLPLQNGYLYFGEPFQDPELQPLQAYWDDANTQPAARPMRTINGYPARNGAPAQVFVGAQYSMRVRDSQGREVFYAPNVTAVDLGGGGLDIIAASGGQTVVTLTNAIYTPGSNAIDIALNGIIQISGQDYFETGTDRITMAAALSAGDQVRAFARSTFGLTQAVLSDWQAEVFNGAGGGSQNFVLLRSPGAVANLDVSVTTAGVGSTLRPLIDYTLSGSTVTIMPAPAVGTNNVLIRYGRSLPQDALRGELADPTSASNGDALIAVKRTDVAAAVALTLHSWNQAAMLNVRQVGVTGDGSTDDATLLNTLGALGIPLYIPYTSTGYKIASTVTFNCDVYCDGFFSPTTAIGGAASDYNRFAIVLAPGGYPDKRQYTGIKVIGTVPVRAANVSGIRVDCPASTLNSCIAQQCNYGIVVRNYSITLNKCSAFQCNTNLSAYARDNAHEINVLTVWGGNYDSAVNCAANLGDTSWSDAMPFATGSHGVNVYIGGGAAFDASEVRVDGINGFKADVVYFEGSNTGIAWRLGGYADNSLRDVEIGKCFYNGIQWAVKCFSAVSGLVVRPSFYTAVTRSAVHIVNNNATVKYERGVSVGSFAQGQELYTGFGNIAIGSITFDHVSADFLGLTAGVQVVRVDPGDWFPGGVYQDSVPTVKRMNSSSSTRFKTTPTTGNAGTVASNVFTFTTLADCYAFNGGDRIVTAPAGATVIRAIDYTTGVATLGGGTTANGAATISQVAATWLSETTTYSGAAPAAGAWGVGDHCTNGVVTVGTPKGWRCTVAGTPGTWVSEGNL